MVGNVGFHGQPGVNAANNERALEIGYGFSGASAAGICNRGGGGAHRVGTDARHQSFRRVRRTANEPSLAIIRKLGFVRTGEHIDPEDGLEHVFELQA